MHSNSEAESDIETGRSALPNAPSSGTVLAFDYGTKRIGVAVGELDLRVAHPLPLLRAEDQARLWVWLRQLIEEWRPVLVAVGLPSHFDGSAHQLAPAARRFAAQIESRFGVPTAMIDEHMTSVTAALTMREAGVGARRQAEHLDSMAACEILQGLFGELAVAAHG
jgi:putative holliday junction resolvase